MTSLGLNHLDTRETNKRKAMDSNRIHATIGLAYNVRVEGLGSARSFAGGLVLVSTRRPPCQGIGVERQGNKGR